MKSKTFIWIIFLLTFISCNEANIPDPPVPPIVVVAEVYASPSSVEYRGRTTLYWNFKNVTSVTKDGIPLLALNGSEDITALLKDTSFTFEFKGLDGKIATKTVFVAVTIKPVDARTELFCSKYYQLVELKDWFNNSWSYWNLSEQQLRIKEYFYTDGTAKAYDPLDNKLVGAYDWSWISADSILIGDQRYKYTITDSTFICSSRKATSIDTYKSFSK